MLLSYNGLINFVYIYIFMFYDDCIYLVFLSLGTLL